MRTGLSCRIQDRPKPWFVRNIASHYDALKTLPSGLPYDEKQALFFTRLMLTKSIAGIILYALAFTAGAESVPDVRVPAPSAYAQDSRDIVIRSGTGLCWRTGYWTEGDAVVGCDGTLVPPIANPIAPPIVANPQNANTGSIPAKTSRTQSSTSGASDSSGNAETQ
jgi:hypothetical protein